MKMEAFDPPGTAACARAPVDPALSDGIGIARLLCILGVVYVHGWTGLTGEQLSAQAGSPEAIMRWTLVELCGRSAVPLLSLISGWLAVQSTRRRSYARFAAGKVRAILLPMVVWNMIALVLVTAAGMAGWIQAPWPSSLGWLLDELFCLAHPANIDVQMAFLRDLFLCMLCMPIFIRLSSPALSAIALLAMGWAIGGWATPILLRPAILLFFLCGILAARHGFAERMAALPLCPGLLPFFLILPAKLTLSIWGDRGSLHADYAVATVDLAIRFAAALMVWRLAILLANRPAGRHLRTLERYAFLLFCSHVLFMWLLGPLIGTITGPMGQPFWPLYFMVQPLLALGFAMLLGNMIALVSPSLARLLSGGRLYRASPAARPLAHAH
jgi:fucose 4-O-acetylase-like acetyltransferase